MYILCAILTIPICFLIKLWIVWKYDFANRTESHHKKPLRKSRSQMNNDGQTHEHGIKDMDSLYISFMDFLTCLFFVLPSNQLRSWTGFLSLNFRRFIHNNVISLHGTRFLKSWSPRAAGGELLMETSEMIYLVNITTDENGRLMGKYEWTDFLYISNRGELKCADKVQMEVDLISKLLSAAQVNSREISALEAVQLLTLHFPGVVHPVLHSYSNWGIDTNHEDSFVRWMGKITVLYNYFGSTWFARSTFPFMARFGYIFDSKYEPSFAENMRHILHSEWMKGLPSFDAWRQLAPFSVMAHFLASLNDSFCRVFTKYENDFNGIDRSAMFAGTVVHSMDHIMFSKIIEDPMWIFLDSTEFSASGRIGGYALACLSHDLPGLMFAKRFKDAPHPFYKEVYEEARKINPELADLIDTCIVK